ncbi:hypothetical protein SUGI_0912650 [Cryptomeria japonica]|nr:hypothetical protein SUGI_0912650 [Cryptomeria japonica]
MEQLAKMQEPPITPKIKCEKRNPCVSQHQRSDSKDIMVLIKFIEGAWRHEMRDLAAPTCNLLHSSPVSEVNLAMVVAALKVSVLVHKWII